VSVKRGVAAFAALEQLADLASSAITFKGPPQDLTAILMPTFALKLDDAPEDGSPPVEIFSFASASATGIMLSNNEATIKCSRPGGGYLEVHIPDVRTGR
jgi:hypothetical protein